MKIDDQRKRTKSWARNSHEISERGTEIKKMIKKKRVQTKSMNFAFASQSRA